MIKVWTSLFAEKEAKFKCIQKQVSGGIRRKRQRDKQRHTHQGIKKQITV